MTMPNVPPPPPAQGDGLLSTIIPYKNPKALSAYYCGVFALIPVLGLILGPIALILGLRGLKFVKGNPTAKGTGHAITGIVLGSLTILLNYGTVIFFAVAVIIAQSR